MKIKIERLPLTLEEWESMSHRDFSHPENVCAMFIAALYLYSRDRDSGERALNLLCGPRPLPPRETELIRERLAKRPYLPLAYFAGAAPENGYTPAEELELEILPTPRPQDLEPGFLKVYLRSAGARAPRPLALRKKGNSWCLWEFAGVLTGIRAPDQAE